MAIEYTLYLNTPRPPSEILSGIKISWPSTQVDEHRVATDRLLIYVGVVTPTLRGMILDAFNFKPGTMAMFRVCSEEQREEAIYDMLQMSLELASAEAEHAVLLFNGEYPIFLKTKERWIANSEGGFWTPQRLRVVAGLFFEVAQIPSL